MKKDIVEYVSKCLTYQQVKVEHQVSSDLLNPIPIPQWKWDKITMDFVFDFLLTQKKHDSFTHFLLVRLDYSMDQLTKLYVNEIIRLYEIPLSVVSNRDPWFTSSFWKELQYALGT